MEAAGSTGIEKVKVVIFDVDGTLYDQARLRKKMLFSLLSYYALRPWKIQEMLMLQHFRTEREKKAGGLFTDLESEQYNWCVAKGNYSLPKVKEVVKKWIFTFPNKYLKECMYPGTAALFKTLKKKGIVVAIYSDYKAHAKLNSMGLKADMVVSSTDPEINCLKPRPEGLIYIAEKLGVSPENCLFIGDRQEMDGECAIRAQMPYLIIEKRPYNQFNFFDQLNLKFVLSPDSINHESNNYSS